MERGASIIHRQRTLSRLCREWKGWFSWRIMQGRAVECRVAYRCLRCQWGPCSLTPADLSSLTLLDSAWCSFFPHGHTNPEWMLLLVGLSGVWLSNCSTQKTLMMLDVLPKMSDVEKQGDFISSSVGVIIMRVQRWMLRHPFCSLFCTNPDSAVVLLDCCTTAFIPFRFHTCHYLCRNNKSPSVCLVLWPLSWSPGSCKCLFFPSWDSELSVLVTHVRLLID